MGDMIREEEGGGGDDDDDGSSINGSNFFNAVVRSNFEMIKG